MSSAFSGARAPAGDPDQQQSGCEFGAEAAAPAGRRSLHVAERVRAIRVEARERRDAGRRTTVEVYEAVAVVVEAVRAGGDFVGAHVAAGGRRAVTLARASAAALVLPERD